MSALSRPATVGGTDTPAVKVLLVGDSGVGKSHLMLRFTQDSFPAGAVPATVGVDYRTRTVVVENRTMKMQIWDTAGLERFRAVTEAYFRGAQGVLLVYDVTSRRSLDGVSEWLRSLGARAPEAAKVLVANKVDVSDKRQVTTEEGQSYAKKNGLMFVETSAIVGTNVEDAFMMAARQIVLSSPPTVTRKETPSTLTLPVAEVKSPKPNGGKEGCC